MIFQDYKGKKILFSYSCNFGWQGYCRIWILEKTPFYRSSVSSSKSQNKGNSEPIWSCSACATFSMPTNLDENPDNRRTKKEVHDPFGFTWREIEGRVNNHKGPLCLMRSPSFHTFLYKCPLARKPLWLSTVNPIFSSEKKSSARENIQKHVVYAKKSSHEAIKIFHIQNRSLEKLERKWKMFDDWKFYDAKSHDNYKLIWSLEP